MSRITLNVGGRLFETTVQTLTKCPDSYFSAFCGSDYRVEEEARFIDRDPRLFEIVLGFLRQGVISQAEFDREIINDEFAFYNLPAPQWPAKAVELVVPICLEWKYLSNRFVQHGITPRDSAMPFLRGSLMGEHFINKILPTLADAFDDPDSDRKILCKLQKVATKHGFNKEFRLEIHETTADGNPYGELIFEKL